MEKYDKAHKIESAIKDAILNTLESKQDIDDAKTYFDGMSINDYIEDEEEYIE